MPVAPVAKGLIFSISLLIAAGIAVYDNPQVREWIEESRRKLTLALNGVNEHPARRRSSYYASSQNDISTREDTSPAAAERRRQARDDILRRGRVMEERRRSRNSQGISRSTSSFDQLVNPDGSIRESERGINLDAMASAITTAAESVQDEGLRNRTKEAVGFAMGSTVANPFADEMGIDTSDEKALMEKVEQLAGERERCATLRGDSPLAIDTSIAMGDTRRDHAGSEHESELLVDLTPTTSVAPSVSHTLLSSPGALIPTSTINPDIQPSEETRAQSQQDQLTSFQSIQEWASLTLTGPASFYSPPESERQYRSVMTASEPKSGVTSTAASVIGSNDLVSEGMEDVDALSDADKFSTPSTWSEVGSVMSED